MRRIRTASAPSRCARNGWDGTAASKGARTATMIELLTGTAALAAYLGSFLDFGTAAATAVAAGEESPPAHEPASA